MSGFRGRNPPASLKRPAPRRGSTATRPRFRGRNPPASLKRRARHRRARRARGRRFRGRNPPASLKRRLAIATGRGLSPFPGEKSPGLIEAVPGTPPSPRGATGFRGRNPPASLKHNARRRRRRAADGRFRGRNPPASLKLHDPVHSESCLGGFPGEKSPGLIEALSP